MATRRRKITRSAVRRVKHRESKNAKLKSLRSRKHSSKRMRVKQRGGGERDDFRIFMVYCVKKSLLGCPDNMNRSTLVGTICYYPNNSDFYFFGFNTFEVKHNELKNKGNKNESYAEIIERYKRNRMMVFDIICKICGITKESDQGIELRKKIDDKDGIFRDERNSKQYTSTQFGSENYGTRYYVNNILYCLRLNTILSPTLSFFTYRNEIISEGGKTSKREKHPDTTVAHVSPPTTQGGKFGDTDICKLEKEPDKLSDDTRQTLLEDGDNVVLLVQLESLKNGDIKSFGTRGLMKKNEEIFTNASKLQTEVPEASETYKECVITSATTT